MRRALFPGSFDPFTNGHAAIVSKAIPLFDEIVIGIGQNSTKHSYFNRTECEKAIETLYSDQPTVTVKTFSGLTVDFCREISARFILRGLRSTRDFEYENAIAHMNRDLDDSIETVFLLCNPELAAINSSIVREIHKNGGDISKFVPRQFTTISTQ